MKGPATEPPNPFEQAILAAIGQQSLALVPLLGQIRVIKREFTGVGSFSELACDGQNLKIQESHLGLPRMILVPSVPSGMGAVLFCENGRPTLLEIYTFQEPWDGTFEGFRIESQG